MSRILGRRLLMFVPTLFGASVVIFLLIRLAPGDLGVVLAGPDASEDDIELVREQYHLNDPIPVQYYAWMTEVLQADLGYSYTTSQPVTERVTEGFKNTCILFGASAAIALVFGLSTGVVSGATRGSRIDRAVSVFCLFVWSMPAFWLALVLVAVIGVRFELLPFVGMYSIRNGGGIVDLARHLILPASVLGLHMGAGHARIMRTSLGEVMQSQYITTAKAKGLPNWRGVVKSHALPNAVVPYLSQFGLSIASGLGGAVVVESVFAWPGLGTVMLAALRAHDYPTVQGGLLFIVLVVLVVNLLVDVALTKMKAGSFV